MKCTRPLRAWRSRKKGPSGKLGITFERSEAINDETLDVPCGQCVGCRLERSRQWAMRCVNEASLHEENCFITLTYDEEHLPEDLGLHKEHFQKFMKRLRKALGPESVRYFHCGEYGEEQGRPHYHSLLFGWTPKDLIEVESRGKDPLFESPFLTAVWGMGMVRVGAVTFESAAYVAKYCVKKLTGKEANYSVACEETGEVFDVQPPYATMSRKPGIGADWFKKFSKDCYPSDFVVHRGRKMQPPKYYDGLFEKENPEMFETIKGRRKENMKKKETSSIQYHMADRTKTINEKSTKRGVF